MGLHPAPMGVSLTNHLPLFFPGILWVCWTRILGRWKSTMLRYSTCSLCCQVGVEMLLSSALSHQVLAFGVHSAAAGSLLSLAAPSASFLPSYLSMVKGGDVYSLL